MSSSTARATVWAGTILRAPARFLALALLGLFSLLAAHPALAQQTFTVACDTQPEGTSVTCTVTKSVVGPGTAADVQLDTQDVGEAIAGVDYTATTQVFNFGDNDVNQSVAIAVSSDTTVELDEDFEAMLTPLTVGWTAGPNGVGTILNDDSATLARLAGFQVTEGNAPATPTATFTVTLSAPVDVDVTVDIATEPLVATAADNDYTHTTGTLTFPAGTTTSQTFPVLVNGDAKVEFNQRFQTRISNVQAGTPLRNVTIFDAVQTANIINDDQGRIAINDVTVAEGTGVGTTAFTFNVVLLDAAEIPAGQTLSVNVATANGTATTTDSDYVAAGPVTRSFVGTLNEVQTFVVQVNRDAKVEPNETFLANLTNLVLPGDPPQPPPPGGSGTFNVNIQDSQATATITNDDAASFSITDRIAFETNTGSTPSFSFTATLSAQVDVPVNVDFATANGTATTGDSDYVTTSGTLNFLGTAGETKTVLVTVNGDDKVELDEVFLVNLSNIQATGRNVTFADSQGLGTIVNDETATLSINDVTLVEGAPPGTTPYNFTVTLDRALANSITVDVDAVDDTATSADSDYAVTGGTLNFAGTQNESVPFSVNVNGDSNAELNEVFRVVLSNLQAGGLAVNIADQGAGTINNDDVMDLAITKDDGGANSFPGGPIAYQLNFQNLGTKHARGVVITDMVPANTTFDPVGSDPGWNCAPNGNAGSTCTLNVGTVSAGGSASATFALTVDAPLATPLNITNSANINDETDGAADTDPANNNDTDTTLVVESAPTDFFTLDPCRVIDTRTAPGSLGGPALAANNDRIFLVAGMCGIPATAKAISVNIAVTGSTVPGNVRIHPGGTTVPMIASINYSEGQTRSNNAIAVLNASGELAVFAAQASGTVHFILDVNGYFE